MRGECLCDIQSRTSVIYCRCVEVVDMLESVLPAEMYRTLTGLMFSILMDQESGLEHAATGVAVPSPREFEDGLSGKNGCGMNAVCAT